MSHAESVIHSDPEIMGGTPVFVGTRVPFQTLLDYLEAGQPLAEFLDDFPTVTRDHAVAALEQAGHPLQGANLLIRGDVPIGSGLSSSAAIEVASGLALLENSGLDVHRLELVQLCRRAENDFVGARVGIMDQFISGCGQAGHALMLDCRSLEYRLLPLPREVSLVVCNTTVKHELASGEYNTRRAECEEGVRHFAKWDSTIRALRDVSLEMLDEHAHDLPTTNVTAP